MGTMVARHRVVDPFIRPADVGMGISEDDKKRLNDYYWAMRSSGVEAAQKAMDIADQWSDLEAQKASAIDQLQKQTAAGIPDPPPNSFGYMGIPTAEFIQYMGTIGSIYSNNFKPALDRITGIYRKPEEDLRMAAATSAWILFNIARIAVTNMDTIRTNLGIGDIDDAWSAGIIKRGGLDPYAGGFKRNGEFWVLKAGEAAANYAKSKAPELYTIMHSAEWTNRAKQNFLAKVDREAVARQAGIQPYEVDSYLKQYGMAGLGEPITITTLIVVAIVAAVLAGGAALAVGLLLGGQAAANVAKKEFDTLAALHAQQMKDLKEQAQKIINGVAEEKDPAKRQALATQGNSSLDQSTKQKTAEFDAATAKAKLKTQEAVGGGFDLSGLLLPLGIGLAVVVGLKVAKVI